MQEAVRRYLGVFLPFIATLICAHYVIRTSGSQLVQAHRLTGTCSGA